MALPSCSQEISGFVGSSRPRYGIQVAAGDRAGGERALHRGLPRRPGRLVGAGGLGRHRRDRCRSGTRRPSAPLDFVAPVPVRSRRSPRSRSRRCCRRRRCRPRTGRAGGRGLGGAGCGGGDGLGRRAQPLSGTGGGGPGAGCRGALADRYRPLRSATSGWSTRRTRWHRWYPVRWSPCRSPRSACRFPRSRFPMVGVTCEGGRVAGDHRADVHPGAAGQVVEVRLTRHGDHELGGSVDLHLRADHAGAVHPALHDVAGLGHRGAGRIGAVGRLRLQRHPRAALQVDAELGGLRSGGEEHQPVQDDGDPDEGHDQTPGTELACRTCHVAPISQYTRAPRSSSR